MDGDDDNSNNSNNNDNVCSTILFNICNEIRIKLDNKRWYEAVPKSVETSHEGKEPTSANRENYS